MHLAIILSILALTVLVSAEEASHERVAARVLPLR